MDELPPLEDVDDEKNISATIDANFDENQVLANLANLDNVKTKQKVLDEDADESAKEKKRAKNNHRINIYAMRIVFAWISMLLVIACTCMLFFVLLAQGLECISLQALRCITNALCGLSLGIIVGFFMDYYIINNDKYKVFRLIAPVVFIVLLIALTIKRKYDGVYPFHLDTSIINTVVISFIVNIIGLLAIVFLWLYPKKEK
ncbi:MAG: hypothetical protein RRY13_01915 [Akkermansia sp.]